MDGIGQTEDENAAGWFSGREGFTVTAEEPETKDEAPKTKTVGKMTVEELKAYAVENGIDLGDAEKKADILAVIAVIKETEGDE